jgi:cation diffusion facilitator CzcD-associated flavoprotein CzcO/acetyl esterase/lipase
MPSLDAVASGANTANTPPLDALIIGTGFGGIGMGVALRRAGIRHFAILEKKSDVGGVWRDNTYPGAACDVPSHLYSFSFEPNPRWSRVFSPQAEIHAYLQHCATKYGLMPHIRFNAEVASARFDEAQSVWRVTLTDGTQLSARQLISAVGQLSLPAMPRIDGIDSFAGRSFHSAHWDHRCSLASKRVAVVGTGASAIQFVPAIADTVSHMTVFQRSPAHILPRGDRAYSAFEKWICKHVPFAMKLYRLGTYVRYESRALGFTKFKAVMKPVVGWPFRRLLARQVPDAALRARLMPDYPIGCKRILLSSDYLATLSRPNVTLQTQGIRRITPKGVQTDDGAVHAVDAIIYGTGFAATDFLSPMRITGRGGVDLNTTWRGGAQAYLGMSVPGFPNFFMLYGPNTNLGHNSIVYMLESQIEHVMRCFKALRKTGSSTLEVQAADHERFNAGVQQRLERTVWNGCTSWYVDANGHNSTNWPGFTLSFRWLARHGSLQAYRFTTPLPASAQDAPGLRVAPSPSLLESLNSAGMSAFLRSCFKPLIGPRFGAVAQRRIVGLMSPLMPGVGGVLRYREHLPGTRPVRCEVVAPKSGSRGGAILYLHGGAFCLGNPDTHRSITTRLAVESGMDVWVPDYRLAPEHPYPAALEDALASYAALRHKGYAPGQIVLAGDSAGAALALSLALALRERGDAAPAGMALISPVTDAQLSGPSLQLNRSADPMINHGWLSQGLAWYQGAAQAGPDPLRADLSGLPAMYLQVGEHEVLLSDTLRLAKRAAEHGVPCTWELHAKRWHVFHLQALYLHSARTALRSLAAFAVARIDVARTQTRQPAWSV